MEGYNTYLIEKGFSAHTIDSYLFAIRQLHEKIGGEPSNENLLDHKDWLAAHFAVKTVNLRITAINSYLDFIEYPGIRPSDLRNSRSNPISLWDPSSTPTNNVPP